MSAHQMILSSERRLAFGTERKVHQSVQRLLKRTILKPLALWVKTGAHLTIGRPYIPGYFPRKNSTMSMLSPIPCAMIGTARLRPVRK